MIRRHAKGLAAELVIALERCDPGSGGLDEILDDRRRDVVAVERGVERARVAPRAGLEPVALADAVVERRVGVEAVLVGLVERAERRGAVCLFAPRRQDRAVLPVRHRHVLAGREPHGLELRVRRRQRPVGVVRRRRQPAGQRHQSLAGLVEHVFLLAIEILDRKAIQPQRLGGVHPAADGRQRNLEQLGVEPRLGLLPPGKENLDLLPFRIDGVVPLILVVAQRREVPDPIRQLSEVFRQPERVEQPIGSSGERALQRGVALDAGLEALVAGLPRVPALENVGEVPLVAVGDVLTAAAATELHLGRRHVSRVGEGRRNRKGGR